MEILPKKSTKPGKNPVKKSKEKRRTTEKRRKCGKSGEKRAKKQNEMRRRREEPLEAIHTPRRSWRTLAEFYRVFFT